MKREDVVRLLKKNGFKLESVEARRDIHTTVIGKLRLHLLVTNQVRVIIETCGMGSYYIVLEKSFKLSEMNDALAKEVSEAYSIMLEACDRYESKIKKIK